MPRIVVLNPKGGSGKTTISINLASHFAMRGEHPVLMDYDVQGSSTDWVRRRTEAQPHIQLISVFERGALGSRRLEPRVSEETGRIIVDTPAAVDVAAMVELIRRADKILVPVLPSRIDIHACSRCIGQLLLVAKVKRRENRLGIIANRVRLNTVSYQSLLRFLETLGLPIVATLRDSQHYVRAAELGMGLDELTPHNFDEELTQWESLFDWLNAPAISRVSASNVSAARQA
jgi:chromosome partitioning protein